MFPISWCHKCNITDRLEIQWLDSLKHFQKGVWFQHWFVHINEINPTKLMIHKWKACESHSNYIKFWSKLWAIENWRWNSTNFLLKYSSPPLPSRLIRINLVQLDLCDSGSERTRNRVISFKLGSTWLAPYSFESILSYSKIVLRNSWQNKNQRSLIILLAN